MFSALIRTARLFKAPSLATVWATEFIDDRITTPRHRKHIDYYATKQLSIREGIIRITGGSDLDVEYHFNNLPGFLTAENKEPGLTIKWSSTSELAATT